MKIAKLKKGMKVYRAAVDVDLHNRVVVRLRETEIASVGEVRVRLADYRLGFQRDYFGADAERLATTPAEAYRNLLRQQRLDVKRFRDRAKRAERRLASVARQVDAALRRLP